MRRDPYKLDPLLRPVIEAMGYEFLGFEYHPSSSRALLRLYIDSSGGITVGDCERVSHQVSGLLDVEDPIPQQYALEVSSPGFDRPLFEVAHYRAFVGYKVKLQLLTPKEGRRRFTGRIKALVGEDEVVVECDGVDYTLPLAQVDRARLVPED
ncbi:MAG: ribosome maturation factor RimP [Candidatus Competibacterales bacterium]